MKYLVSSLSVACLLCVVTLPSANGQIGNYVLTAYQSAMAMKEIFEYNVENFRAYLNVEAADFGYYFTDRIASALETATTAEQGAALQACARNASDSSVNEIIAFNLPLVALQEASMSLHLSVYQQLIETNLKTEDLDHFYYLHSQRMDEEYDNLNLNHLEPLYDMLLDLWLSYFTIVYDLDECIFLVMGEQ